jgi:hypothetical protein
MNGPARSLARESAILMTTALSTSVVRIGDVENGHGVSKRQAQA